MVNSFLSIGLYEKAFPSSSDLKEKLRIIKKLGFDYPETSIDESDEKISRLYMDDAERTALTNCMRDKGLPIGSICLSALWRYALGCENDNLRNKGIKIVCLAIDLAANLGVCTIQLPGYDAYYDSRNANSAKHFYMSPHKLTDHAANRGILFGFETMENDFMDSTKKTMKTIHIIHSPFLHLYPDAGNLSNAMRLYDKDIREDLEKGDGHLIALHLKDTKCGVYRNLNYGEGDRDLDCVLLKRSQLYIRCFVCEFWYQEEQDWMRVLQRNYNMMFINIGRNWQLYEGGGVL